MRYVVIAEYKDDPPLVMETYLHTADYEAATERMKAFAKDPRVIRVAIARLVFAGGHRGLLPLDLQETT